MGLCLITTAWGQVRSEQLQNVNVQSTKALKVGETAPVRSLRQVPTRNVVNKRDARKRVRATPNFFGRRGSKVVLKDREFQGEDPLVRKQQAARKSTDITPLLNIDGLASQYRPGDPTGDVGFDYYLQAVNATTIAVYDKSTGALEYSFSSNTLWTSLGETGYGDPIILFDHQASRWIITEFTSPTGSSDLLLGISQTEDPLGSYDVYAFSPPSFPDYPKWAVWSDTYMVTTNESSTATLHQYFFDRHALLDGAAEVSMQRVEIEGSTETEAGFFVSTPVSFIGSEAPEDDKPMALKLNDSSWGEVDEDAVDLYTFDVDFDHGTTITKTSLVTTPYDGYPCDNEVATTYSCVSQEGSNMGVDAIPELIMNVPHYRNFGTHESIVLSFITDITDGENQSGIRWMELRRTDADWEIYQEGTYAPEDDLHRFMPSISIDKDGNMGLAYNTSSPDDYIGIRFTGRYAEDPLGEMTVTEYTVVEGSGDVDGARFGDYAHMSIDPLDHRTFWYTSEYGHSSETKTRILSFQLEQNTFDIAVVAVDGPVTSASLSSSETVSTTITNIGTSDVANYDITLSVNGNFIETFTQEASLASNESYEHTFETTVDLSTIGEYEIQVEVALTEDEVSGNDAFTSSVSKIANTDATVDLSLSTDFTCFENTELSMWVQNSGADNLTEAVLEVYQNEELIETINWTGSLSYKEAANEFLEVTSLQEGDNVFEVVLTSPNGTEDQLPGDNSASATAVLDNSLVQVELSLITDNYPEETTWEILDNKGATLYSGGPYEAAETEIIEQLCVDTDACYTFVINDSFNDGICCEYGEGSYTISAEGEEIVEGDGVFGSSKQEVFCVGSACNLNVELIVVNETPSMLGSITVDVSNSEDYLYSIDGGTSLQASSTFAEVPEGTYDVYLVEIDGDCLFQETVTVGLDCNVIFTVASEFETESSTFTVTITAEGGDGVYAYSIDGGLTFQASDVFTGVKDGVHDIVVQSFDERCTETLTYELVSPLSVVSPIENAITIAPNPTEGVFEVHVAGYSKTTGFMKAEVLNLQGKVIQSHRFSRFDDEFIGTISLYAYPDGLYFLRLLATEGTKVVKVVKQ